MSTSLFFIPTDQNSLRNPNDQLLLGNTHLVNGSGEIRAEPQKSRGRKLGSKTKQQNQKKQKQRGMGIAQLERHIAEEEEKKKTMDKSASNHNHNASHLPVPDPEVVLQGFPSYCGAGGVGSGQIMIDPLVYNASNTHCDTCFKKKRLDGDQNVVRSNGTKYSLISPPIKGYDHLLQSDQRSKVAFIARSAAVSVSTNPYADLTGSMEVFGSSIEGNPRNGSRGVKELEFFPRKYDNFTGIHGKPASVATAAVGDCGPTRNTSTIDLSLKL